LSIVPIEPIDPKGDAVPVTCGKTCTDAEHETATATATTDADPDADAAFASDESDDEADDEAEGAALAIVVDADALETGVSRDGDSRRPHPTTPTTNDPPTAASARINEAAVGMEDERSRAATSDRFRGEGATR
jgi:hypothetical protein